LGIPGLFIKSRRLVYLVDPMAEEREWLSPYNYCSLNPINRIDPDGALDDGYKDLKGNYKWFEDETDEIICRDDKIWLRETDDRNLFEMASAGLFDKSFGSYPGIIKEPDRISKLEMWLDSPSERIGEGIGKIGANIGYNIINSPYGLITGQTIGGRPLNSTEKTDAFIDVAPLVISLGLTGTREIVKVSKHSLEGYNKFVKKSAIKFKNKNWQKRASMLYKSNKINQSSHEGLNIATFGSGTIGKIYDELDK